MENANQKPIKSNPGSFKNFLKFIFLGNGKYWPTTLFVWMIIIYLISIFLINQGYDYAIIEGIGMPSAFILFWLSLPFWFEPLISWLDKFGLAESSGSGWGIVGFEYPKLFFIAILWLIIIFLLNYLIVKKNRNQALTKLSIKFILFFLLIYFVILISSFIICGFIIEVISK